MIISPKVKPIRFWSQKVLPLVYDNSLSYYEVLCKVRDKINELVEFVDNELREYLESILVTIFAEITYIEATETINLAIEVDDNE